MNKSSNSQSCLLRYPTLPLEEVAVLLEQKYCELCGGLFLRPISLSAKYDPNKFCVECGKRTRHALHLLMPAPDRSRSNNKRHIVSGDSRGKKNTDTSCGISTSEAHLDDRGMSGNDGLRRRRTSAVLHQPHEKLALAEKAHRLSMRLRAATLLAGSELIGSPVRSHHVSAGELAGEVVEPRRRMARKRGAECECENGAAYLRIAWARKLIKNRKRHGHVEELSIAQCSITTNGIHFHIIEKFEHCNCE